MTLLMLKLASIIKAQPNVFNLMQLHHYILDFMFLSIEKHFLYRNFDDQFLLSTPVTTVQSTNNACK